MEEQKEHRFARVVREYTEQINETLENTDLLNHLKRVAVDKKYYDLAAALREVELSKEKKPPALSVDEGLDVKELLQFIADNFNRTCKSAREIGYEISFSNGHFDGEYEISDIEVSIIL